MSQPRVVIGLVGLKGAGKDTLCKLIQDEFAGTERYAFADALKEELAAACKISVEDIEREKVRYRIALQWWGTEFRRMQNPRYWLDKIEMKIKRSQAPVVVITDVRYVDEGHCIKSHGGILVKVLREMTSAPKDPHSSEQYALDMTPDMVVWNPGTLEEFRDEAKELFAYIRTLAKKRANPSS